MAGPGTKQASLFTSGEFELVGHADQISYRSGPHLLHHVASVDFYCGLAGSDFGRNLLIEHSGDHKSHNLTLSCGQWVIALLPVIRERSWAVRRGSTAVARIRFPLQIGRVSPPSEWRRPLAG